MNTYAFGTDYKSAPTGFTNPRQLGLIVGWLIFGCEFKIHGAKLLIL